MVVAWFCGTALDAHAQQRTVLTVSEAKTLAQTLLNAGDSTTALQIASVISANNPEDIQAKILVASAAREAGQLGLAIQAARDVYRATQDTETRYIASRIVAISLAEQQKYNWSQYWLRLARQNAPNQTEARRVANDYQQVRQLNPWSFNASLSAAPSSNINGGSQGSTGYIDDNVDQGLLDFLAAFGVYDPNTGLRLLGDNERALSGTEGRLSFGAQYRLSADQASATFLSANISSARYRLSDEAKEESPTSSNRDFNRDSLSFGVRHVRVLAEDMRPATFSFGIGKNWYASDPSNRYMTASFSQPFLLTPSELLTFGIGATVSASYSDDIPIRSFDVSLRHLGIQSNGDRLGHSVRLTKSASEIEDSDYVSLAIGVNYAFAKPIYGFGVTLNADATYSDIGDTRFAPFDRTDTRVSISADIAIPQAEVFGFQPVVSLGLEKTESTVDQFDSQAGTFGLDFRSSF